VTPDDVLRFWFEETPPKAWWTVDAEFDRIDNYPGFGYRWRDEPGEVGSAIGLEADKPAELAGARDEAG